MGPYQYHQCRSESGTLLNGLIIPTRRFSFLLPLRLLHSNILSGLFIDFRSPVLKRRMVLFLMEMLEFLYSHSSLCQQLWLGLSVEALSFIRNCFWSGFVMYCCDILYSTVRLFRLSIFTTLRTHSHLFLF